MLRRLRWQLTLLYLFFALSLVVLMGAGVYGLVQLYFENTTDSAIEYRMATQFTLYGIPLPPQLAQAQQTWEKENTRLLPTQVKVIPTATIRYSVGDNEEGEGSDSGHPEISEQNTSPETYQEDPYDARLATIFVLPLSANGSLISNPNPAPPPIVQNSEAVRAAIQEGYDWRTTSLPDGTRLRLLTYRTSSSKDPAILQVGRLLSDEDRVLEQLLLGLIILGGLSTILLGLGSWWLSGRSLGTAQKAWDQQQTFVSNASHELRTPLTLIRATADFGLRGQPTGEQKGLLEDILTESDYMNRLIDDLLLLSRLDTHRLRLERVNISLKDLLEEVQRQFGKLSGTKGVNVVLEQAPGTIWGDPARMRQVLLILLDNALRFTPPAGTIRLGSVTKGKFCKIYVSDNGSGIPAEHLPHLFERFYQADQSGSDENRNNGLGLSIAKALVEAQGGTINIISAEGKGTQVTLSFPCS